MKIRIRKTTKYLALGVLSACLSGHIFAEGITLDDIDFTALPGNEFEVQLDFSDIPPAPQSYALEEPARIVLDFEGVESELAVKKHALAFENAQSAVVLTSGGKTRLILNLNQLTNYTSSVDGSVFSLRVGGGDSATVQASSQYGAGSSGSEQSQAAASDRAITDVDFSRGEQGEGLVKLKLSDPHVSVDVQQVGSKIRLNFFNTDLPSHLDRRLDVLDFATPVKSVDATSDGTSVAITVEAGGDYDYLAYQADGEYVVSVKPLTEEELSEKKAKFSFVGEKLSLNFQDIEVRSVLQLIADFTDLNLVASDTVDGKITLRLDNVPWDQALDIVLKAKGLDKRLEGNVLLVAPAAEIAERERLQVEANKQLQELAPLVTEFIRIKYADAKELFELFNVDENEGNAEDETATRSILSERGAAIVDQRTNTIILTDTEEKVSEFKALVDKIDIPVRQVEISARIVIASTDFSRELGFRWGISGVQEAGDNLISFVGTRQGQKADGVIDAFTIDASEIDDDGTVINDHELTLGESLAVDLGVKDTAGPSGSLSLGLLTSDLFLDLELSALENSGYGEIASQPKVLTGDKQKATIRSGQEIAYQEATSSGATSVEFKEAVLKLEVTPQITPDNRIILDLFISQDNVAEGQLVNGVPALDITDIETKALIGDGQTLVLGGIFQYQDIKGEEKVPLLGDIPYVGRLFKNKFRSSEKREILIFVTPKIVDDQLLDR